MKILVIDIGGSHVKMLVSGQETPRRFVSGPHLTPEEMVAGVKVGLGDWTYDSISIGFPGPVRGGRVAVEPVNLGPGWVGFDFEAAFACPVRLVNDAALQALGSYQGGKMLFLGLGTGLGSALIVHGIPVPLELAHLPYRKHRTFEDYVGLRGLVRVGKKKWRAYVDDVVRRLAAALLPDDIVLGGGNIKKLKRLPVGTRAGANANAFHGGMRLWDASTHATLAVPTFGPPAEVNPAHR